MGTHVGSQAEPRGGGSQGEGSSGFGAGGGGGPVPYPGSAQSGSAQSGSAQSGSAQSGSAQSGSAQSGSAQSGSPQSGWAQSGSPQSGWAPWAPPPPPVPPRKTLGELLSAEGAGSRLLAWVGGAITLVGVVLLLVLAIQRGWLGPVPRVLVGAAFGVGLVGVGVRLHRVRAARTGAFALAATGLAVLYLDVVAATALYEFLPVLGGLGAAVGVAAGGIWLALRWDSEHLATAVIVATAVCAPVITGGPDPVLVAFLLVCTIAATPLRWPTTALIARVPPVLASIGSSGVVGPTWQNTAAALAVTAVAVVLALWRLHRVPGDVAAQASLAVAVVPTLLAAAILVDARGAVIAAATGAALIAVWVLLGQPVAGVAGMVAVAQATAMHFDGSVMTSVLLAEGLLLAAAAWRTRDRVTLAGATGFAVLGALRALPIDIPPHLLIEPGVPRTGALAVAALLLAVSVAVPWAAWRAAAIPSPAKGMGPWLTAGALALYGAAALVLTATLLAVPDRTGFLVGHVLITVSWAAAALVLLAKGIETTPLRAAGLALVGAAVAKLVLFDLSALDGIARVAVFIAAGLILLAAGTRYARLVALR
jgi:uncharacterized membrane protein